MVDVGNDAKIAGMLQNRVDLRQTVHLCILFPKSWIIKISIAYFSAGYNEKSLGYMPSFSP